MALAMRALRFALVSRRAFCACPEEATIVVAINTAAKNCMLTLKPDGNRDIYENSCALLL